MDPRLHSAEIALERWARGEQPDLAGTLRQIVAYTRELEAWRLDVRGWPEENLQEIGRALVALHVVDRAEVERADRNIIHGPHEAQPNTPAATMLNCATTLYIHAHRYASNAPAADLAKWNHLHALAVELEGIAREASGYVGFFPDRKWSLPAADHNPGSKP